MPPNRANATHLRTVSAANNHNSIKRGGVVVRDEEVIDPNPSLPAWVEARAPRQFSDLRAGMESFPEMTNKVTTLVRATGSKILVG